jgi:predicted outer membrane repeat protein
MDEGVLTLSESEFDGNECDHDGGAIYAADEFSVADTIFTDNHAGDDGGGVYLTLGRYEEASISGTITSSSATSTTVFSGNTADDNGEALYIRIADDWYDGGELDVDSVDFGTDDVFNRTISWYTWSPGDGASFSCTYWYNCY